MINRTDDGWKPNWGLVLQSIMILGALIGIWANGEKRDAITNTHISYQQKQIDALASLMQLANLQAVTIASNQAVVAQILKEIHDRHRGEDTRRR